MSKILGIFYILTFGICATMQGQVITMPQTGWQTYTTCHGIFYDSGGEFGDYSNNENGFLTICPEDSGQYVALLFYTGYLHPANMGADVLFVRSGIDTSGGVNYYYNSINPIIGCHLAFSTDTINGCLTMQFKSDSANTGLGWRASIFCYPSYPDMALPGINCARAVLTSVPYSATYETTWCHANIHFNSQPGACTTYSNGDDKFYKYVSSGSECLSISLTNITMPFPNSYASLSVWKECPGSGGYCIGSYFTPVNPPTLPSLSANFNLDSSGTYYIIVDSGSPAEYVQYDISILPCSVGIDEQEMLSSFLILPNPSNGTFTFQTNLKEKANVVITNALGKKITEKKIISEKTAIDLSSQPNGIYFVIVSDDNGNKITRKIVKM